MTTFSDVVDDVFTQHLAQYGPPQYGALKASIAADETITMLDFDREQGYVSVGMYVEIDNEIMLAIRSHENHLEVRRGMLGTDAVAHTQGALISVAPRFFRQQVLTEIKSELGSWDQQIFPERTVQVSWPANATLVDLPNMHGYDPFRILSATQETSDREPDWSVSSLSLRSNPEAAYGYQLFSLRQRAAELTVTFGTSFVDEDIDMDVDLSTVGMTHRHEEIIRLGAAYRIVMSSEILRTNTTVQGQPRYAEEVPPQFQQQLAEALMDLRDQAYHRERDRLRMKWGI